jgi:Ca2+-dependent lipid-binding protein
MAHIQSPYSWIELRLAAKDLPRMDVLSKSDPMAVVQLGERGQFVEIGRTECIKDDQSPTWHTPIRVQYKFEVNQTLRVLVYDVDPDKLDFMGRAECSVADVVAARGNYKQVALNNDTANAKKSRSITAQSRRNYRLKFNC